MSLPPTYVAGFHDEAAVRKMPYRKFGSRIVSQLTYGASALGGGEWAAARAGRLPHAPLPLLNPLCRSSAVFGDAGSMAEAKLLIRTAVQSGINLMCGAPPSPPTHAHTRVRARPRSAPRTPPHPTPRPAATLPRGTATARRRACWARRWRASRARPTT